MAKQTASTMLKIMIEHFLTKTDIYPKIFGFVLHTISQQELSRTT